MPMIWKKDTELHNKVDTGNSQSVKRGNVGICLGIVGIVIGVIAILIQFR